MTDKNATHASVLFNIDRKAAEKIADRMASVMVGEDPSIKTVPDLIAFVDTFEGKERDYAMFSAGKASALNDLRHDPEILMHIMMDAIGGGRDRDMGDDRDRYA